MGYVKLIGGNNYSSIREKEIVENILSEINAFLTKYTVEYIVDSNQAIKIVRAIITLGKNIRNLNKWTKYKNGLCLYYLNYPVSSVDTNQDNKDSAFRATLDHFLRNYTIYPEQVNSIKNINIIIIYNKEFEDIPMEDYTSKQKTAQNEDAPIFYEPITPRYSLDQVILNDDLLTDIFKSLLILEKREILYKKWGFSKIDPEPNAILNFYGPSGTGKTMTAHAIASYLKSNLLALNYADIESKFVGDAPKNLVRAFDTARESNAVLFFDEADSFLGKRITNVSTSSDQAVNSLRSQMLILLENFSGIILFATNLIKNYDRAFESRIFKHLKFDIPDTNAREAIIKKTIPEEVPFEHNTSLSQGELDELVNLSVGFSGRDIKNSIREALLNALMCNRDFVIYLDFYNSFNTIKTSKDKLQNETGSGTISDEKKKVLEKKIQNQLTIESLKNNNSSQTVVKRYIHRKRRISHSFGKINFKKG